MLNKIQTLTEEQQRSLAAFHEVSIDAWLTEEGTVMVGEHEIIVLSVIDSRIMASPAFAEGYHTGYAASEAMGDDSPAALTDYEFTERIRQTIPNMLAPQAEKLWRQGYIFGWVMSWCEAAG
jgi:hypothetical protein